MLHVVVITYKFCGEGSTGFSVYIDDSTTALATDRSKIEKVENELILTVKHEKFCCSKVIRGQNKGNSKT